MLEPGPRDTLFCLVHGLYRNRARLFREQLGAQDPACPVPECHGGVQDREHVFCSCSRVVEAWLWMRSRFLQLLPTSIGAAGISNEEFILLQFPKDTMEAECVWLLGNFVEIVDNVAVAKNRKLNLDQVKGVMRSRIQGMSERAVICPQLYNI